MVINLRWARLARMSLWLLLHVVARRCGDAEALVRIQVGELIHSVVKIVAGCGYVAAEVAAALMLLLMWLVVMVVAAQGAHPAAATWTACTVSFYGSGTTRCRPCVAGRRDGWLVRLLLVSIRLLLHSLLLLQ